MYTKYNNQDGFAITSSLIAWALGIAAIVGGGTYVANQAFDTADTEGGNDIKAIYTQKEYSFVDTPVGVLSETEKESLMLMREEEKLAKDVYQTLAELWDVKIFTNISYSETRHELSIQTLLEKYDLPDPIVDESRGVFATAYMQELYDTLVAKGRLSLIDALQVGATIEDLDIYDLNKGLAESTNSDMIALYKSLLKSSYNHMKAFHKQLEKNGGAYEAQYLTQAQIDEILALEKIKGDHAQENGGKGQKGAGHGNGGGGNGYGQGNGGGNGGGQGRGRMNQ